MSKSNSAATLSSNASAVIGKGYDLTTQYANSQEIRAAILDIDTMLRAGVLMEDTNNKFTKSFVTTGETGLKFRERFYSNSRASAGANIKGIAAFSTEVNQSFTEERTTSSVYSFASERTCIEKEAYFIERGVEKNYLLDSFKQDLEGSGCLKPGAFIKKYGTHLMLGCVLGARVDFSLSTIVKDDSASKELGKFIEVSASVKFKGSGAELSNSEKKMQDFEKRELFTETREVFRALGGNSALAAKIDGNASFESWRKSIDTNRVWVDYYDQGLVLLSELVTSDENRRAELRNAITAHFNPPNLEIDFGTIRGSDLVKAVKGDKDVDSKGGKTTGWGLKVEARLDNFDIGLNAYKTLKVDYVYDVVENKGDHTHLRLKASKEYDIEKEHISKLLVASETLKGGIRGQKHGKNDISTNDNQIIKPLSIWIDRKGNDDGHIRIQGKLSIPVLRSLQS